jgi:hypothetical protein
MVAWFPGALTANGSTLDLMPRRGQVVEWLGSFRRTWEPLKPYDWLCRIRDPENPAYEIELPFAFLVQAVAE